MSISGLTPDFPELFAGGARQAIGVDIESVDRFGFEHLKDKPQRRERLLLRIFTKGELAYCLSKRSPQQYLAARFCAKEACFKALSQLLPTYIALRQIEVTHNDRRQPQIVLHHPGPEFQQINVMLSLSHCADKAIAFVVATQLRPA